MKEYVPTSASALGTLPSGMGIPPGQTAPDALVRDSVGQPLRLSSLYERGPILLAFYRGGWCPYCSFEIHELTVAYGDYQRRGVTPVAVSVDKEDEGAKTKATYSVPFPILSDPERTAHVAFHVVHHAESEEVAKLKAFGIDVERSSGRTHHDFAVPALFLIDRAGVVRWAHADPDYKTRPSTAQILAALDAAGFGPKIAP
jgi:peroxiredoxin